MQLYSDSIDTTRGAPLRGATVTVRLDGALATIYDADGVAQSNPLTTDSTGSFSFRAANGEYTLTIEKVGITTKTQTVQLYDPADDPASAENLASTADSKGAGLVGFLYAAVYGAGTAGKWLQDLATSAGAALIGFVQSGTGAVTRTVQDKLREVVSVRDFGAVGDGVADDTAAIQASLNSGALVIDGCGMTMKINSALTVPTGVEFRHFTLNAGTAGINMVLVNNGVTLRGKLVGTGTTSTIERAVYPAADGVTDVVIDCEISNLTVGVHAQPLASLTPKRWRISGHIHDIVGTSGVSEGYGVLLSPAESCEVNVRCANIARHAVYLSAGAAYNNIHADVDGCNNLAVQLFSTAAQPETRHNTIRGKFRNLTQNAVNQGGAVGLIQKASHNDVSVVIDGSGNTSNAIWIEGQSGGPYPTGNNVHSCEITGSYLAAVINVGNADRTAVRNNSISAGWATAAIFLSKSGAANVSHGGYVEGNSIYGVGATNHGIANAYEVPFHVGLNDVRNIAGSRFIDYSTARKRTGFLREYQGRGTTGTAEASSTADLSVALPEGILTGTRVSLATVMFGSSGVSAGYPLQIFQNSDTQITVRVFNGHSVAQTFDLSWRVSGD